jgi:hypothetical protein
MLTALHCTHDTAGKLVLVLIKTDFFYSMQSMQEMDVSVRTGCYSSKIEYKMKLL